MSRYHFVVWGGGDLIIDTGVFVYGGRPYGLCQVSFIRVVFGCIIIWINGCLVTSMDNTQGYFEGATVITYIKGTFSRDRGYLRWLVDVNSRPNHRVYSKFRSDDTEMEYFCYNRVTGRRGIDLPRNKRLRHQSWPRRYLDMYPPPLESACLTEAGSADKTAKRYDRTENTQETFQHPDLVKDIFIHDGYLYTACSDENIRQWSLDVSPFGNNVDN